MITSFNDHYVFVRYEKHHPGASGRATSREDLVWLFSVNKEDEK